MEQFNEFNKETDCVCGEKHKCGTRFFYDDISKLAQVMPRGVHILYAGENEKTIQSLTKLYRTSVLNPATSVVRHYSGAEHNTECGNISNISNIKGCEDIKMVAGEGGGTAAAKQISCTNNLKLVLIGAQGLNRFGYMVTRDGVKQINAKPDAVLLRYPKNDEIAESFCQCINVLLSLADWDIAALINGTKICPYVFKEAKKAVLNLIKTAKEHGKHSERLKSALNETQLRLCVLSTYINDNVLNCSGALQAAAAMELLFNHERRALKSLSTNTFLLAPFVLRLYAAFLESKVLFAPPPDNNFRSKRLIQFLGINPSKAHLLMPKPLSFAQTELSDYRLSLYAQPLAGRVYETLRLIDDCYALWLRLFDDDGFWVKDYLDSSDLGVCLSLGADLFFAPTLLSYMRQKGVLDNLI